MRPVPIERRHVWVDPVPGAVAQDRHPGLLHAWVRGEGGWMGRVTYLVDDGLTVEPVVVTQVLPAVLVHPA